ncbi:S-adenosyl-l-methionine hydroxide adenosyltransferase family protein [Acidobacteriota bacterium]
MITDFGTKDYFIGTLKGVMKKINPEIEIIDIANDIPSYNILTASFVVDKTYRFFPDFTIFLVVVDPGVGTNRRILLVQHENRIFIAPDNGTLTPILQQEETMVSVLNNETFFLIRGHSTFEARDKMAPAAAYLSAGIDPRTLSSPVTDPVLNPGYFPTSSGEKITARVVYIDKFGNIMTNVTRDFLFAALRDSGHEAFKTEINGSEIAEYCETYARAGSGPFMLIGSHENLEIAVNQDSAADLLNVRIGQEIGIIFVSPG